MNKKAFTLPEILITFIIVGVVAALTLPHLQLYLREAQYVNRLKKFYSVMNQAFRHRMAQDGVTDIAQSSIISSINGDTTAYGDQANFTAEMMKLFKVIDHFDGGSYPGNTEYKALSNEKGIISTNNDYTLILLDGTVMHIDIKSVGEDGVSRDAIKEAGGKLYRVFGTIEVDINGDNDPNQWGRDYYRFVVGQDGLIYPFNGKDHQIFSNGNFDESNDDCKKDTGDGYDCAAHIMHADWAMDY